MPSQVVAFLRRSRRGTDWSQEEIAELYRIEHALLQARFSLETDRGVSDEGDPWFVFCRADGEVLVHITRSEDGYLLYGLGLPWPLTGRVIGDISKSFVNQIPLNIPVRQTDGPKLYVHPASALAIIIGMIILANDDVALVSNSAHAAQASGGEGAEPADRSVKALVLAVLGKFADGTLLGGERLEANHQEGAYLNIVCTIAAVMMGASVALDTGNDDFTQLVSESTGAAVEPTQAQQSSSDLADTDIAMRVDASFRDSLSAAHAADALSPVPLQDDAPPFETTSFSTVVETAHDVRQQAPTADPGAVLDHEKANLTGDTAAFDQPKPVIQTEAGHAHAAAASEPAPEAAKQAASSSPAPSATAHQQEASTASVDDSFQHLLKSVGLPDNLQAERVLSHAAIEILHSIPAPAVPVSEDVKTDTKGDTKEAPGEVARGKLYPLFDNAAQEILTKFLQSNPDSQAYVYDHNVIVYDGDKDFGSRPVTVQVWEFDTGATIAVVGHADNPAVHA